jgi:omega-6 fatty acid desaturase (delta-12 desaturase)
METQEIGQLEGRNHMLADKQLILATRKYAQEDRGKSWWSLLSTLVLLIAAYAGAIINVHIVPQIACSLLAGLISVRMFIIYHDYLHGAILRHSGFAKAVFTFFGMFILAPSSIWKRSHDYHHAHNSKLHTSSIGSFPLTTKQKFLAASKSDRRIYLFIRHPLTIASGYIFVFLWGMCLRTLTKSADKHIDGFIAIIVHFGIGFAIYAFFGVQSFLLGFLFPSLLSSAFGAYLFYAQHNFPAGTHKSKEDWSYAYAALHSSSYIKMNGVMNWITGNIGYHHIHHINPRVPFYRLPEVFKEMKEMQHPGTTTLLPRDIYRCLRVKVWDPEVGKMIGLKEIYASS